MRLKTLARIASLLVAGMLCKTLAQAHGKIRMPYEKTWVELYLEEIQKIKAANVTNLEWQCPRTTPYASCLNYQAQLNEKRICNNLDVGMKRILSERKEQNCMRTACANPPMGLQHAGLCWWHATYQHHALYLTQFAPNEPRPSPREMRELLNQLYEGDSVVVFPGFKNWSEVSYLYKDILVRLMANRQAIDGVNPRSWGQWVRGPQNDHDTFLYGREFENNLSRGIASFIYLKKSLTSQHGIVIKGVQRKGNVLTVSIMDSNDIYGKFLNHFTITEDPVKQTAKSDIPYFTTWNTSHKNFEAKVRKAWRKHCDNL